MSDAYRDAPPTEPCHECGAQTEVGVGCVRCDLVFCDRHRPAADARCASCEREWAHESATLARKQRDYDLARLKTQEPGNAAPQRETVLTRHPMIAVGLVALLVLASVETANPLPMLASIPFFRSIVFGRWRDPRRELAAARRRFLAERHVRLLKSSGGSAG